MIGLKRGTVKLLPYDYRWVELYKQEEKLLLSLIGEYVIDIQHVGSTSIKGLDSKPIIDIAVGIKSLNDTENFRNLLENAGYQYRGRAGVEGRIMFAKGSEDLRTHYLHIEVYGGDLWENHIYFRDYLQLNKKSFEEYSRLKKELAEKFKEDRNSYTSSKNNFINSTLKKAREEFSKK
ncbi:GrpB family protein [Candidatus Clostridium radicumherbarum]|uniref:GrpB family protein n=1 Tax=Candidatus Clostridium radicumherbarum TaxID=3381662 RepID=A0ABW8TX99_9CLOT